jgi:hypothetical protein
VSQFDQIVVMIDKTGFCYTSSAQEMKLRKLMVQNGGGHTTSCFKIQVRFNLIEVLPWILILPWILSEHHCLMGIMATFLSTSNTKNKSIFNFMPFLYGLSIYYNHRICYILCGLYQPKFCASSQRCGRTFGSFFQYKLHG